jgi:acetylglutamate kinase
MHVIKIGGNELNDASFLERLAQQLAALDEPVIIVHGGGRNIADMQIRLGLQPVKVDGLRVTDGESLTVAQMVLSGYANKLIVQALLRAGVDAVGLSGVDGGLLRCQKKAHPSVDLGFVGQIVQVRPQLLRPFLEQGITPVISPISVGIDGQTYNVNADEAAGALAQAMSAQTLTFVSDVPGVLDPAGQLIGNLTSHQTEELIVSGAIRDGMVPKVRAALTVVGQGVPQARIVNLAGLANGGGTLFIGGA